MGTKNFARTGEITLKSGVDVEMEGLPLFITLQFSYILCVYVCVVGRGCWGEQSFLYYILDLHSLELTMQDSHPSKVLSLYDIKTFYYLYISDISDPF